jgi:hypothetical protein
MARIRTIKPEFWVSRTNSRLSHAARLTFIALWNYCDDEGRGVDESRLVKAAAWPLDDGITASVVAGHLDELEALGLIVRYSVDGASYLAVRSWNEHQKIDRPTPSKFPSPPADIPNSMIPRRAFVEASSGERKGRERNRERKTTPSTTDERFERFWSAYPTRHGKKVDKSRAHSAWNKLGNSERERAERGVAIYADHCVVTETLAKDAHRWLRDNSFDDWQEPGEVTGGDPREEWGNLVKRVQPGESESGAAAGGER